MSKLPSLKNLSYLVQLHREKNFNRAAKASHVSQSTLSAGIQNLEENLAGQLIERDNKSFIFTRLGEQVVERARHILAEVSELSELAQSSVDPMSGTIRLGCIPTIAPFLLSQIVQQIGIEYPRLSLSLREDTTKNLIAALDTGELDLIILALPVDTGSFHTMAVGQDPFLFVSHSDLHVAHEQDYESLPDGSIFLLQNEHCITGHAISACQMANKDKINPFAASSLHTLVQMVNAKMGSTFLPKMALDSGILHGTALVATRPQGRAPYREIGLVWRQTSSRLMTFRALGQLIERLLLNRV